MEIIIDGYNLIGVDRGLRGDLEHERNRLTQQLSLYYRLKGFYLTVVFDGWCSGRIDQIEEKRGGVAVVYSRQGEKADSVVIRIARQKGSGCVVVSSDREIRTAIERFGATAIYAAEFKNILRGIEDPGFAGEDLSEDLRPAKKGNPRQLSKAEKNRREKLKKLRL